MTGFRLILWIIDYFHVKFGECVNICILKNPRWKFEPYIYIDTYLIHDFSIVLGEHTLQIYMSAPT